MVSLTRGPKTERITNLIRLDPHKNQKIHQAVRPYKALLLSSKLIPAQQCRTNLKVCVFWVSKHLFTFLECVFSMWFQIYKLAKGAYIWSRVSHCLLVSNI